MVSAMIARRLRLLSAAALLAATASHGADPPTVEQARYLWAQSPHGRMLERILPRSIEPRQLPEPQSDGARLTARYCIQCHYLPNPQMHTAERWPPLVGRMVWRMRGRGNLGTLMKDMMAGVEAPTDAEVAVLTEYLEKHGQRAIDPAHPALRTTAGQIYSIACSQCHALPDPRRHTAREWPAVVKRMQQHMAWSNTVVGVNALRTNPVLDTAQIVGLLQRHARRELPGP